MNSNWKMSVLVSSDYSRSILQKRLETKFVFHLMNFSFLLILFHSRLVYFESISFRFRIVTWNVGESEPDCNTFEQLGFASVTDVVQADLIVFGFQETNKNLFRSTSFHKTLKSCLEKNNYIEIVSDYVGSSIIKPIWLYIYASDKIVQLKRVEVLKHKAEPTLKVYQNKAFQNVVGYKGLIASRIQIDDVITVVFVNMHLPAGEGKSRERCELWSRFDQIYGTYKFKDDYLFAFGDQNWRTRDTLSVDNILQAIEKKEYQTILDHDELIQMHHSNKSTQCLSTFFEAPITFPPTYKYIPNSDEYQRQKNNEERRPSYTDRILVSSISKDLQIVQYSALKDIKLSDHRPVFADIVLTRQSSNDRTQPKATSEENKSREIESSTKTPRILIGIIIIILIICIVGGLAIYYFIIRHRKEKAVSSQNDSLTVDQGHN